METSFVGWRQVGHLHLRQPEFTYWACGSFTEHFERNKKFRETGNLKHLHRNELDGAWFDHDAVYSDIIDLAERTTSDKVLKARAYENAINQLL